MKTFAAVIALSAGCTLSLAYAPAAFAQSGAPSQSQMIDQLRPVPSALATGHQGLPIGGAAPIVAPQKQYTTKVSTGSTEDTPAPSQTARRQPAAAPTATAPSMPGCTSAADSTKPALSLKWITFEFGSAQLRPESIEVLQTLGKALKENFPDATFLIEGHTDASGTFAYNQELSLQRAQAVKDYLSQQMGVNPDHLDVSGLGYCSLANPTDPRGAENRRVVVVNKAG
jgi:outer membrane protein OmpA-like peptidoglycan-associated protein